MLATVPIQMLDHSFLTVFFEKFLREGNPTAHVMHDLGTANDIQSNGRHCADPVSSWSRNAGRTPGRGSRMADIVANCGTNYGSFTQYGHN